MRGLVAALLVLMALGGCSKAVDPDKLFLVLTFPDGEAGGFGKIRGPSGGAQLQSIADVQRRAGVCGARYFRVTEGWHYLYLMVPTSAADQSIVQCFAQTPGVHFFVEHLTQKQLDF